MGSCRFTKLGTSKVWMALNYYEYIGSKRDNYDMILHSSDGGYSWNEQMNNRNYDNSILHSIHFSDELNGIAVGWYGLIYMTFDGGQNWERVYHKKAYWKDDKFDTGLRSSSNIAFVFDHKGIIYKYDKNLSSISNLIDIFNVNISPNPTSDFITITLDKWALPQRWIPSDKVQIFDMLGLEVYRTQTGMSELLKIDVSHLPAGVYFIRIGDIVEKFVKM